MFRGIHTVNMDAKGRLAIPTRYRKAFQEGGSVASLVITIHTEDPCLMCYPMRHWLPIEESIEALPSLDPKTNRIKRLLMGHATEGELDAQGRVLVAPMLREYASMEKKVVIVGQGKKCELWSEDAWEAHRASWLSSEQKIGDALPESLSDLVV